MSTRRTSTRRRNRSGSKSKSSRLVRKPKASAAESGRPVRLDIADVATDASIQVRVGTRKHGLYVDKLKDDIEKNGQVQPILVYEPRRNGPTYVVVDGHRRLEALKQAGKRKVDVVVISISDDAALVRAFKINHARKALTPLDIANTIVLATKRGRTIEQIAEEFGISKSQLYEYKSLWDFPESIKESLADDQITMAHAIEIGRLANGDENRADEMLEECIDNELSARQLRIRFTPKNKRARRRSRKKLFEKNIDGVLSVRRFAVSEGDTKAHFKWLKGQLNKVAAEVEKLEKSAKDS